MMDRIKPTAERLLVCIGSSSSSTKLIHAAKKMATDLHAQWFAVYVEKPAMPMMPEAERNRVLDHLRLAEQLGAETITLAGSNIADEIIKFARQRNITRVVAGKPRRHFWESISLRNPVDQLVRMSGEIDVCVIAGEQGNQKEPAYVIRPRKIPLADYGTGVVFVILASILCFLMYPYFDLSNLIMVYLLGVLLTAVNCGRGPAILVSFLSVLAFDVFFVPPRFSLTVEEAQYIVTFIVMLLVALVISQLASQLRRQAEIARLQERQAAAMHGLSRQLVSTRGIGNILQAAVQYIAEIFDCHVAALLPDEAGKFKLHPAVGDLFSVIEKDMVKEMTIARSVYDSGQPAGWGTKKPQTTEILYVPLHAADSTLGVLALRPRDPERLLVPEQVNLLESLVKQVALALEVEYLTASAKTQAPQPSTSA